MYDLRLKDDISIISKEASLFSLECLYDDVTIGILDGYVKADSLSNYISVESDDDGIIGIMKSLLKFIWNIIKSIFTVIKKIFMVIYRYFTTKRHVENMKTFEDIIDYILKCHNIPDEVAILDAWILRNDVLFKFVHMGLIFTKYLDDIRCNEDFSKKMTEIEEVLDKETEATTHKEMFEHILTIYMMCQDLLTGVNISMYKDRLDFMQAETRNSCGVYAHLTEDGWNKLRDYSKGVTNRLESVRAFVARLNKLVDTGFSEIEDRIELLKMELTELSNDMKNGLLDEAGKAALRKQRDDLRDTFDAFNGLTGSFAALKDSMVSNAKNRAKDVDDSKKVYGFAEIMSYSDRALTGIIYTFTERLKHDAARVNIYKDSLTDALKEELTDPTGVVGAIKSSMKAESIMFDLLFTPDNLPQPDFDIPEHTEQSYVYESIGISPILTQIEYQDVVDTCSFYMEEVGLDVRNPSDVTSFRNQLTTNLVKVTDADVDDEHKLTKSHMTKRRFLIISSIKMLIEAINAIRDSLYKTVSVARDDLNDLVDNIPVDEIQETKVTIPASLVKSIYSHNYNKIIEFLVENRVLKLDGTLDHSLVDDDELNNRIKTLMFNRRKHFEKIDIKVPLMDLISTLRGKLTAFDVMLLHLNIRPLDEKIPTTEELERYQKYLASLVGLLRTDIIGAIVATKSLINSYYGGVE